MALTDKLTAIGNAIRGKTGGTDLLTLDGMVTAINGISTGANIPSYAFNVSGKCRYRFANNGWNWFINNYGNQVTTSNIVDCYNMFYGSTALKNIPFSINCSTTSTINCEAMFQSAGIISAPEITVKPSVMISMFSGCVYLKEMPDSYSETIDLSDTNSKTYSSGFQCMFYECNSLRKIPSDFLKKCYFSSTSYAYQLYYQGFTDCYVLDELKGLPIIPAAMNNNLFVVNPFYNCHRVKNIIFDTNEDGTAKTASWKNQTINLTQYIGYAEQASHITEFGIVSDKEVTDDTTYAALKNDPDWFTCNVAYSRYNKTSAIATINSLPDTSAYIAANGGTNTIKFKGEAGSATDGGAINTMTEEEIAVATAKGWTVTFV